MRWFEFRPNFVIPLDGTADFAIHQLNRLKRQHPEIRFFKMSDEYGELHVPPQEHRLWSPFLAFYIHTTEQRVVLRGRFSPRLSVWTCVWAIYLAMTFTIFFAGMLAISQWTLSRPVWGGWICLAALISICLLHIIAIVGQQWSSDQMEGLRNRLEELLQRAEIKIKS